MLYPEYSPAAAAAMDSIEEDKARRPLWNAICDAIDLVCDRPGDPEAIPVRIDLPSRGFHVWQIRLRVPNEDEDTVLVWRRDGNTALILHIGAPLHR